MNKSKLFNKIIIIFIICNPFLDLLSILQEKYLNIPISISSIIRFIFMIFIFVYIFRNKDNRKLLIIFLIYFILSISSYFLRKLGIYTELVNLAKIFYLPIMMIFFSKYDNKLIDDKFIFKIYVGYIILFSILHIFKLDKDYINIVGSIVVGLLPIILNYVLNNKNIVFKILFMILLGLCIFIISSKLIVIGSFIVTICVLISHYRLEFIYNDWKKRLLIILIFLIFTGLYVLLVSFSPFYTSIKQEIVSLNIHKFKDIYSFKSIDTLLFSSGLTNIKNSINVYLKGGYDNIMYGIGKTKLVNYTGIDYIDILFTTGIFGSVIFFIMFMFVHRKSDLRKIYYMSYITFLVITIFNGHTLIYPSVSIFIAMLYLISSNSLKIEK